MSLGETGQWQLGMSFESSVVMGAGEGSTNGSEADLQSRTVRMRKGEESGTGADGCL